MLNTSSLNSCLILDLYVNQFFFMTIFRTTLTWALLSTGGDCRWGASKAGGGGTPSWCSWTHKSAHHSPAQHVSRVCIVDLFDHFYFWRSYKQMPWRDLIISFTSHSRILVNHLIKDLGSNTNTSSGNIHQILWIRIHITEFKKHAGLSEKRII